MKEKVVSLLSGGLDSFAYSVIWEERGYEIYSLIFDYGQSHRKEVEVAKKLSNERGWKYKIVKLNLNELATSSLLSNNEKGEFDKSIIVPLRNAIFLTIASSYAYSIGARDVIFGASLEDIVPDTNKSNNNLYFSTFPDCSPEFTLALELAVNLGFGRYERGIKFHSPAMEGLSKADLIRRFKFSNFPNELFETWSCYNNGEKQCGKCLACQLRRRAFRDAGVEDLTGYES